MCDDMSVFCSRDTLHHVLFNALGASEPILRSDSPYAKARSAISKPRTDGYLIADR